VTRDFRELSIALLFFPPRHPQFLEHPRWMHWRNRFLAAHLVRKVWLPTRADKPVNNQIEIATSLWSRDIVARTFRDAGENGIGELLTGCV